jgi:hypothetical protein
MGLGSTGAAALAALALVCATAGAHAQEFRYRGWAGDRLPGDKANGCVMALQLDGGVGGGFVMYGDPNRTFRIGLGGRGLELEPGKEGFAAVAFDDGPPIVLKGSAVSKTLALFEPLDFEIEGGLARLVESARSVRMTFGKRYMRARLSGSSKALELLARCVAAPAAEARARPSAGEPQPEAPRAAEFGFLRQGSPAAEAHERLIGAGWQAEEGSGPAGDDKVAAMRSGGLPVRACEASGCALDYADAYGNALRVTVTGEGEPRLKGWRLNPPDAPAAPPADAGEQEVPPEL